MIYNHLACKLTNTNQIKQSGDNKTTNVEIKENDDRVVMTLCMTGHKYPMRANRKSNTSRVRLC